MVRVSVSPSDVSEKCVENGRTGDDYGRVNDSVLRSHRGKYPLDVESVCFHDQPRKARRPLYFFKTSESPRHEKRKKKRRMKNRKKKQSRKPKSSRPRNESLKASRVLKLPQSSSLQSLSRETKVPTSMKGYVEPKDRDNPFPILTIVALASFLLVFHSIHFAYFVLTERGALYYPLGGAFELKEEGKITYMPIAFYILELFLLIWLVILFCCLCHDFGRFVALPACYVLFCDFGLVLMRILDLSVYAKAIDERNDFRDDAGIEVKEDVDYHSFRLFHWVLVFVIVDFCCSLCLLAVTIFRSFEH